LEKKLEGDMTYFESHQRQKKPFYAVSTKRGREWKDCQKVIKLFGL
jgi:hypothetical protein